MPLLSSHCEKSLWFVSADGERHSATRLDAVCVIFEGLNLAVRAGQGMPSDTLVSGTESVSVGFQSPKLLSPSETVTQV